MPTFEVRSPPINGLQRLFGRIGEVGLSARLDEYVRLKSVLEAGWGADCLDYLRRLIQHHPRLVLMFTGAHTFAEMGPAWIDRFISARRVRVTFLTPEEVHPLLTRPIPEFDLSYAPGALASLIEATHCQPFLTQAVAFDLVQYLNEEKRKEATIADVEKAIGRALQSGGDYFGNVWNNAGDEGRAILRARVLGGSLPDAPDARQWLRDHDVLDADGNFIVPMMARWVRGTTQGQSAPHRDS